MPRVVIRQAKAEPLGRGVWRVTAVVANEGRLPTVSEMGRITGQPHPLQIRLELPDGVSLVTGHARVSLPGLAGNGGRTEQSWLIAAGDLKETGLATLRVRVWSPSVGTTVKRVEPAGRNAVPLN